MNQKTTYLLPIIFAAVLFVGWEGQGADSGKEKAVVIPEVKEDWGDANTMDREAVIEKTMRPYAGPSNPGVDRSTMTGKVLSGYQGWFGTPGDGAERGWVHWEWQGRFEPGSCKIDLWPDVSELGADERYVAPFVHADGRRAEVFSAFNRQTVLRHFQWMKDYGLDGVFVQRFIGETFGTKSLRKVNVVLDHCREGANLYGRTYAVMYDLSGLGGGQMQRVMDDWKLLVDRMQITKDPAYLHHGGKPVVTVWGFGFNDHRKYTPHEGLELVKFLKDDPHYGGCTVMLGVPSYWRTLERDCLNDPAVHELILKADIVSPWTVGRYTSPEQAVQFAQKNIKPDIQWCQEHGKEYMPVVFPGFSWHNMNPKSPSNQIPRRKGEFLWTQYMEAKKAGATMVYQAMFDEVDEGTAIFKCTDDPPVGTSQFVNWEGLPSDFYLKMVGKATRMIREGAYYFDRTISREVLENYLSRSISMEGLLTGKGNFEDNLRMLRSMGAKFIGRSLCLWGGESRLLQNLETAKQNAAKVHEADPEMVLQSCVFEIVTIQVEQVEVPEWAFTALGQPVEKRNFRYADMLNPDGRHKDQWGRNASVPDVRQPETKLWFYFLARSFIDLGIEAIHFGQVEMIGGNDPEWKNWAQVFELVRAYAAQHARRHMVLCDGHVPHGGLVRDGKLLLDFHSFPLRIMEVPEKPTEAILKVGFSDGIYGRSRGGETFSGWKCEHLPYLVELDNWGVSKQPGQAKAGGIWVWGYDEITWFAHQSAEYRAEWLRYAWDWVRKTDPNGHLEMPGSRTMSSPLDQRWWYYANNPSAAVPEGLGDEKAIQGIWADPL